MKMSNSPQTSSKFSNISLTLGRSEGLFESASANTNFSSQAQYPQQHNQANVASNLSGGEDKLKHNKQVRTSERSERQKKLDFMDLARQPMGSRLSMSQRVTTQSWGDDALVKIVKAQKLSGNWTSDSVALFPPASFDKIDKGLPLELTDLPDALNVWITIVMLAVLATKYQHKKGSWVMIENKALKWLQDKGIEYQKYSQAAEKLLE